MTSADYLKFIAAFFFVMALMGGLAFILRKINSGLSVQTGLKNRRLKVVETLSLDPRRRAVILRCDQKDHLVILGPNSETVIDTGTSPVQEGEELP